MAILQGYGYRVTVPGSGVYGGIDMLNLPLFSGYNEQRLIAADADQLIYESGTAALTSAEDTYEVISGTLAYDGDDQLLGTSVVTAVSESFFLYNSCVQISGFSTTWAQIQDLGTYGFLKSILSGDDSLTGQRTQQIAHANDRLFGFAGNDTIHGGDGNDKIVGGSGNDLLYGETGYDHLYGGAGKDTLDGTSSGGFLDALFGGAGNDTYIVDAGSLEGVIYDRIVETPRGGVDSVTVTLGNFIPFVLADNVENLTILAGVETSVTGNNSANGITGSVQADAIYGLGGADSITGGEGDDSLAGGPGRDTLAGGAGNDRLIFDAAFGLTNIDQIAGFAAGDKIALDDDVFTALSSVSPTLDAGAFNSGTTASEADDRILYDGATGALYYDADGLGGAAAAVQFATIVNPVPLSASDFVIVD
jgi:Ca2+-binding RTX toxin-like protein